MVVYKKNKLKRLRCIGHVKDTLNNTFVTITKLNGDVICKTSSGLMGFKGYRRTTGYAAKEAGREAGRRAVNKSYVLMTLRVNSRIKTKVKSVIRGLKSEGISIISIEDRFKKAHNGHFLKGCRRV